MLKDLSAIGKQPVRRGLILMSGKGIQSSLNPMPGRIGIGFAIDLREGAGDENYLHNEYGGSKCTGMWAVLTETNEPTNQRFGP